MSRRARAHGCPRSSASTAHRTSRDNADAKAIGRFVESRRSGRQVPPEGMVSADIVSVQADRLDGPGLLNQPTSIDASRARDIRVEPARTWHGQGETVESEPRGERSAHVSDCRSKTGATRSREPQLERSGSAVWGQSPNHRTTGGRKCVEARATGSPRRMTPSIW